MYPGSLHSESTSCSLLRRAEAKDPEAWRRLCAIYSPLVYQWCRRARLQSSDAADVVQEVFRSVAGAIDGFRRERPGDSFRGWLWTITRNRICDHFRDRAGRPETMGGSAVNELAEQPAEALPDSVDPELQESLCAGLARRALALMQRDFEPRTWQAFLLTAVHERPPADVAEELGMSVAGVYQARSRVLRRLRKELDGLDPVE